MTPVAELDSLNALTTIVEPFFLGPGADTDAGKAFNEWAEDMKKKYGTKFAKSVDELELTGPTLALISGRTADNPRLLKEVIAKGVTAVVSIIFLAMAVSSFIAARRARKAAG